MSKFAKPLPDSTFNTFHATVIQTVLAQYDPQSYIDLGLTPLQAGETVNQLVRDKLVQMGMDMATRHFGPKVVQSFAPLSPVEYLQSNAAHSPIQSILEESLWGLLFGKRADSFELLSTSLALSQPATTTTSTAGPVATTATTTTINTPDPASPVGTPHLALGTEKPLLNSTYVLRDNNFRYLARFPTTTPEEIAAVMPFTYTTAGIIKGVLHHMGVPVDVQENIETHYGLPVVSFVVTTLDAPSQTL